MYCSHVESKNYFIIAVRLKLIFHIAHEAIKNVKEIREECGANACYMHECGSRGAVVALNTDTDLSIQVHFLKHTNQLSEAIATIFNLESGIIQTLFAPARTSS